jgi:AraC-like DNA-binding protein
MILLGRIAPKDVRRAAMKVFVETVVPERGQSWAFLDRRLDGGIPFEWHLHPEFELTLTLNSRGHRYVGTEIDPYEPGDLVLIGPSVPHSWCSREAIDRATPHVALVSWFTQEWAEALTATLPELAPLAAMLDRAACGLVFSVQARHDAAPLIIAMRSADATRRLVLLLDVLTRLCRDNSAVEMISDRRSGPRMPAADARMTRVLDHLHRHFDEPISVPALASLACVSISALHRLFRRHAHMSILDYLVRLRIGRACSLLIEGNQSIATTAAEVGYTNLSLFNRQFTRLKGETPSVFRKRNRWEQDHLRSAGVITAS